MRKLEFVRGNQKSFIRLCVQEDVLDVYEYQMCTHNAMNSMLPFHKRIEDGKTCYCR